MMKRSDILIIVGLVVVLLLTILVRAADTGEIPFSSCGSDAECVTDPNAAPSCAGGGCYCSADTGTCFIGTAPSGAQQTAQNTTTNKTTVSNQSTVDTTALDNLKQSIENLQATSASTEERLATLEQGMLLIRQQLTDLGNKVDVISSQQTQSQVSLQKDVSTVATGLAGLQTDVTTEKQKLETVQTDLESVQRFRMIVTVVGLLLIGAGAILGTLFYFKTRKADSRLVQYVLAQAKQGKRFAQVQPILLRAGWTEDDIKEAYREAMKSSSGKMTPDGQMAGVGGPGGMDSKKITLLAGFALFLVVGIILVLKGITTGHAIYFNTAGELSSAVKADLEKNLDKNLFYDQLKAFDLCVEVEEGDHVASYRILKTKNGNKIQEAVVHCDNTDKYGFAVKFKSFDAFDLVSNSLTCSNLKTVHSKNQMYVLPSKFILPGFKFDEGADVTPYCAALKQCLTATQLKSVGLDC